MRCTGRSASNRSPASAPACRAVQYATTGPAVLRLRRAISIFMASMITSASPYLHALSGRDA